MKTLNFKSAKTLALKGAAVILVLVAAAGVSAQSENAAFRNEGAAATTRNYASLSNMVTMIGADAIAQFAGFFDSQPVVVEPFLVLGEFPSSRVTILGATLADQMAAMVNNEASSRAVAALDPSSQQLRGVLQEIDGHLRVHMSGRNNRGEWRSYVVNVEMSEPVYRALHTYVAARAPRL